MKTTFRHIRPRIVVALFVIILSCLIWGARAQRYVAAFSTPAIAATTPQIATQAHSKMPLHVIASDLLSKAYGVAECSLDSTKCIDKVVRITNMMPQEDEFGVWLDSVDGYRLNYAGMSPEVAAVTRFEDGGVGDFGFFFMFPYGDGEREWANSRQARFAGCLLQEMKDMGLDCGADSNVPAFFTVETEHCGHPVEVFLREADNRFILAVHVIAQ